jgi:hypothetical protein
MDRHNRKVDAEPEKFHKEYAGMTRNFTNISKAAWRSVFGVLSFGDGGKRC